MRFFSQWSCVVVLLTWGFAAQADEGPVYQRHRGGVGGYGGQAAYGFSPGQHPGLGYSPLAPYGLGFNQQPFSGDWFTRPYPSHFDYFRLRHRATPAMQDCPCAGTPTGQ